MRYYIVKFYFLIFYTFVLNLSYSQENLNSQKSFQLQINVTNSEDKLPLRDVTIIIDQINSGGITDKNGLFSIKLKEGIYLKVPSSFLLTYWLESKQSSGRPHMQSNSLILKTLGSV